jgi:hypothetical protein
MIEPDFDPRDAWREGLLAGVVILVASTHLALWLAGTLHLIYPLERLLG